MSSFLTVEDVDGALYREQSFWWHTIDLSELPSGNFSNVKVDFCQISRTGNNYRVVVDNEYWAKDGVGIVGTRPDIVNNITIINENTFSTTATSKIMIYMGVLQAPDMNSYGYLRDTELSLTLKELKSQQKIKYTPWYFPSDIWSVNRLLNVGYNFITDYYDWNLGYLLVNLVKTDFLFDCNQSLVVGKVNTVRLGADSDYKLNGDFVGEYTPTITVQYGNQILPVRFDETLNDYCFDLDLTDKTETGKIRLTVNVETNEVLNESVTDVVLTSEYETINTLAKLTTLFSNGGTGRLGANISLTGDLTLSNSVYLIGNNRTINLNGYKIIVPSDKVFKAEDTVFTNGHNSIQQNIGSKVELNGCTFTGCTGLGSVIDCQVSVDSLDNPTDFTTILNGCSISDCDMAILHGGELAITECTITAKSPTSDMEIYPYCLYQTDGNATILKSTFTDTVNGSEFSPCIFICGEEAEINGLSHSELQGNNISSFVETPQNNRSVLNVEYTYGDETVTLLSDNGFCHAVSGVDTVYTTNVTIRRD